MAGNEGFCQRLLDLCVFELDPCRFPQGIQRSDAMDGQPFFEVTYPVDPGLPNVLEHDIARRLRAEAPVQGTEQEPEAESQLSRFSIVFDREGYSPKFFALRTEKKHFLDTIKLIAYRAETALAQLAREKMHRLSDVR